MFRIPYIDIREGVDRASPPNAREIASRSSLISLSSDLSFNRRICRQPKILNVNEIPKSSSVGNAYNVYIQKIET